MKTKVSGYWHLKSNRLEFLNRLQNQLGFSKPEDWYCVTARDFKDNGGRGLLAVMGDSPIKIVQEFYPDYQFKEWLFVNNPRGFWMVRENRKTYLEWLIAKLNYKSLDDFYNSNKRLFEENYGSGFLAFYKGSFVSGLIDMYPEHQWFEWKFGKAPNRHWKNPENRKAYIRNLGAKLGFITEEDWYNLCTKHFMENNGASLFTGYFGKSVVRAVRELYPEVNWHEWLFEKSPAGFFDSKTNRIRYLSWLGKKLNFNTIDEWYQLRHKHFAANIGNSSH